MNPNQRNLKCGMLGTLLACAGGLHAEAAKPVVAVVDSPKVTPSVEAIQPAASTAPVGSVPAPVASPVDGMVPQPEPRRTLKEFLDFAEKSGHELDESKGKIEFSEAREGLAKAYGLPQGSLDVVFGPLPGANGDAISGTTNWNRWGVFSASKIEMMQPLFTFGGLEAARDAAHAGTEAEKNLAETARLKLRADVAEYYYSYQLAFEFSELAADVASKLDEALAAGEKLRAQKKRGAPSAAALDKLRVLLTDIRVKEKEAIKGMKLAKAAMAWKTGLYGRGDPRWDKASLSPEDLALKELAQYQKIASQKRPEMLALEMDVTAKKALLHVEEALALPTVYVAGQATYAVATQRTDQLSPFAYDPLNDQSAALVVGIKWNLSFFERRAKLAQSRAELIQATARRTHLGMAILADVERAYLDLKLLFESREARNGSIRAAKRVFNDAFAQFVLGTGDAKDLLEALGSFGIAEKSRLETIAQANIAIFKLAQAVGQDQL